jgi:hypothetical protein
MFRSGLICGENPVSKSRPGPPTSIQNQQRSFNRMLTLASDRDLADTAANQSRRDGTACSPAHQWRVGEGHEASPGGMAHNQAQPETLPQKQKAITETPLWPFALGLTT